MKSYSEKLRDPRWQKKRLEILERAGWKCEDCAVESKELQVHHCIYAKGREPWEYSGNSLMSLCDKCHKQRAEYETSCHQGLAIFLRYSTVDQLDVWMVFLHEFARTSRGFTDYEAIAAEGPV